MKKDQILLAHGDGGRLTRKLIEEVFARAFRNPLLEPLADAALVDIGGSRIAFTTDSYTVKPIFFPGGDIGKLAVFGTVNDLAVMGARPLYLSCGFILEEGLELKMLERIVDAMRESAQEAGVRMVTGDTKVVERGAADMVFINTAGIGQLLDWPSMGEVPEPEDEILISGTIGDHGMAVLVARGELEFTTPVESDCASLWGLISELHRAGIGVKWMRDPTRGGLASALNELVLNQRFGIQIFENKIPLQQAVDSACEILGLDPLYLANEGKVICVVRRGEGESAREVLRGLDLGRDAQIIGKVILEPKSKVIVKTSVGGTRILGMLAGSPLPRIC